MDLVTPVGQAVDCNPSFHNAGKFMCDATFLTTLMFSCPVLRDGSGKVTGWVESKAVNDLTGEGGAFSTVT